MAKIDTKVRELVDMVARGELRLPEMQRRYVWTTTRVRDLLDSLYRGYPSGTILVWETDQESPVRDLAVPQAANAFMTQKLLLDGQQRITSLCAVLEGNPIKVRNRRRDIEILFNLEHPEGPPADLTEVDDDEPSPLFDDEVDSDSDDSEEEGNNIQERLSRRTFVVSSKQLLSIPTWVKVTDIFKVQNDWTILKKLGLQPDDPKYDTYTKRLQRVRAIAEYPYVMQVLERGLAYEEVAEIFVRVNSLGAKLRGSDLAMAQVTARWQNSLRLFERFGEELDEKTWFTLDPGLLLRTLVVFATGQSRFKTIQNITVPRMKDAWDRAKDGLEFAINFLRSNAGIEDESLLSSPMLILAVAYYGAKKNYQLTRGEQISLLRWIHGANVRGSFSRGSTETILDQYLNIITRTGSVDELHRQLLQQVGRINVTAEDFVGRGIRSPLFATSYLALKAKGAKDWLSGLGLSLSHQGKQHTIEYHHIFPKSLLSHEGVEKSQINEIANMAFISGKANRRITNKKPEDYIPTIIESQGKEALLSHCIPDDQALWKIEAYPQFLEWRRIQLATEVNLLLDNPDRVPKAEKVE